VITIEEQFLTKNPYSRPGTALKNVKGVVVHWVGNPGTTALTNRNYFEGLRHQSVSKTATFASAHYIVGLTGEIVQCVPESEMCYHVGAVEYTEDARRRLGDYPNNCTLGVELCHPKWDGVFNAPTIISGMELVMALLARHGLTKADVWRHFDVTGKLCPKYYVDRPEKWAAFKDSL
jgi:N-acetylmuramoyl-L-alanine amidase